MGHFHERVAVGTLVVKDTDDLVEKYDLAAERQKYGSSGAVWETLFRIELARFEALHTDADFIVYGGALDNAEDPFVYRPQFTHRWYLNVPDAVLVHRTYKRIASLGVEWMQKLISDNQSTENSAQIIANAASERHSHSANGYTILTAEDIMTRLQKLFELQVAADRNIDRPVTMVTHRRPGTFGFDHAKS